MLERASINDIAEVEEIVKSVKKEKIVEENMNEKMVKDKVRKDAKEEKEKAKMNEKMAKDKVRKDAKCCE